MAVFFGQYDGRGAIRPLRGSDAATIEALPRGVPLKIEARRPRNIKRHRLFWAFATLVAEALNDGPIGGFMEWTPEMVVDRLKVATGHCELARLPSADARRLGCDHVAILRSISFAAMDETEFGKFMDAAFTFVRDDLCTWIEESPKWSGIAEILRESHLIGEAQDAST
ncbi:MAG: hypothetical protein D6773_07830 [Alphaproteobacteria bacterium]|nr:MAG: hypothetical protein D6773_07830 [Alphaproteobacteria bacterium]